MTEQHDRPEVRGESPTMAEMDRKRETNRRLESIGWGLFFILLGGIWLAPESLIPEDKSLMAAAIGVGALLLGVNFARHLSEIRPRGGEIVVGALALIWGVAGFHGMKVPFFPVLFVLIGLAIILSGPRREWRCGRWWGPYRAWRTRSSAGDNWRCWR
ncbi:MAG: hypothetical protein JXA57_01975 [Armatimonadetes bacterium]|nr:hypothetical protein [Armatimonadota bacterium]